MYAEVLVQHPFARKQERFTYEIPADLKVLPGSGVEVPFQKGKKAGLVLRVHAEQPTFKTKEILGPLKEEHLLFDWQMKLADWISEYYFCSLFDALRLMLPKNIFKTENPKSRKKKEKEMKVKEKGERKLELSPQQNQVLESLLNEKPPVALLHGVTGAGKTEIYKRLIKKTVQEGAQALLLVPEISLTPQLLSYFEASFPDAIVIHSRVSEARRAEYWRKIKSGETPLVIGSRSALFSPFKNLKQIILDEEHEWSYKQDQSPRYHARDAALKIAELVGAQLILGSATPSMEAMFQAKNGTYQLYYLPERVTGTALPEVQVVDMREELRAQNFSIFSHLLEQKIRTTLERREQVILFLNRRGSASSTLCRDCGYTLKCEHCEVPLTYHVRKMNQGTLICHHCGRLHPVPRACPSCKGARIKHIGVGTERVETELQKLFPLARIARADRDTMSKKNSFEELHQKLHSKEIDILIGTQMIGKGLDIPSVSLVGIILADLGLHIPDFRTPERIFQLLTQVAGRAGRRDKRGEVIIQTYNPEHPSIKFSQTHNYLGFYEQEISSRKEAVLPPFSKILKLMIIHENATTCAEIANAIKEKLKRENYEVFAAPAFIPRVKGKYQWNVIIQGLAPSELIKELSPDDLKNCRIDVDPLVTV